MSTYTDLTPTVKKALSDSDGTLYEVHIVADRQVSFLSDAYDIAEVQKRLH